jgi:hypothetical protein
MKPETFGLQAAVAGDHLPEEWQVLLAHQAAVLTALLARELEHLRALVLNRTTRDWHTMACSGATIHEVSRHPGEKLTVPMSCGLI